MTAPTQRQQEVLDFIDYFAMECGYPPTVREIAGRFGWSNPNAAICHLKALKQKGRIEWQVGKARTLRVIQP